MVIRKSSKNVKGQTSIEYMLLLAVVVAIVLVAFPRVFPKAQNGADIYFNRIAIGIVGNPPP